MNITPRYPLFGLVILLLISFNSSAELPDGFFIDHGYTFFTVESKSEPVDGKQVDRGFQLSGEIRIYGDAPDRSSIKLVLKKDGDVVAKRRTVSNVYKKGDPNLNKAVMNTSAGSQQPHMLSGYKHQGALDTVNSGTGEYEVDVIYVDGGNDKEYHAHTYTINIGKVDKLDSAANKVLVRAPKYFVSRHQETLSTILSSWIDYNADHAGANYILLWNSSPNDIGTQTSTSQFLRCTVDGEPVGLYNQNHEQAANMKSLDGTHTRNYYRNSERSVVVRHNDRNSLEYRSGTDYREYLIFYQNHTVLPFDDPTDGYPPADWDQNSNAHVSMADYPGRWECQWLDNGKLMRTFAWDVSPEGTLVPHAEQKKGLTLNPGAILVDTYIPEEGAVYDARIVPDKVKGGGFYGWKWKSSDMKKLVKKLPEIGNPFPVPSASEFIPEPDKGPSPQELAKQKREADAAKARAERKTEQEARDARLKQEREDYTASEQARVEENERVRNEAYEKELARTQTMVAEQLEDANKSAAEAMRQARSTVVTHSPMHILFRLLMAVALILSGLLLVRDKIPQASAITDKLIPMAGTIGLATLGIAVFDLLLDIVTLRPIIGDGVAQLAGLASGCLLARETIDNIIENEAITNFLNALRDNQIILGVAALALGIVHLLMGGVAFI